MITRQQHYQTLLHDGHKLKVLWQSQGLDAFVGLMRQFLQWPDLSFDELLGFLHEQNQQMVHPELNLFSQSWQPYAYQPKHKTLLWMPAFLKPELPFLEEDIAAGRQNLLAQLIRPVTALQPLLAQRETLPPVAPDLLIFHWSRCGSTLVSGCFMLQPEVKVLSESMLISDVLLDSDCHQQTEYLDLLVRLQGRFRHQEQKLVIKCNAWDLQYWQVWTRQYPHAAVLGLIRQPEAVLASHQRLAGRHMVRLQTALWPGVPDDVSLLEYRIAVVQRMAALMLELKLHGAVVLDYLMLSELPSAELAALAGVNLDEQQATQWLLRRKQNAKVRQQPFVAEALTATQVFSAEELARIRSGCEAAYRLFNESRLV